MSQLTRLAHEAEHAFWADCVEPWFRPEAWRSGGGFHEQRGSDWAPEPESRTHIVPQSRLMWVAAAARMFDRSRGPVDRLEQAWARVQAHRGPHGWGFDWVRDDEHQEPRPLSLYGNAFALFAQAGAVRAGLDLDLDSAVLDFATHFGEPDKPGLYQETLLPPGVEAHARPDAGIRRTQNSQLHVLEALSEAVAAGSEAARPLLKANVEAFLRVFFVRPGYLHVVLNEDDLPLPHSWSIGHDVEAIGLILEAGERLGGVPEAWTEACTALLGRCLAVGLDRRQGGFSDTADAGGRAHRGPRNWWPQAEALHGFTQAWVHRLIDRAELEEALDHTWTWIRDRQTDQEHRGLWAWVESDGRPVHSHKKGHEWKAAYHEARAFWAAARLLG